MKLDYIYHSGFAIEADGVTVIIDYYKDSSETEYNKGIVHDYLLGRPGELYVLSSHFHPDHFNREVLLWKAERPDIHYIFSKDILKHRRATREDATYINKGDVYEDPNIRIEAFGSTDVGISFLIDLQGIRLFHAEFNLGDTVVTSGYSTVFPAGIMVGTVDDMSDSHDGLSYLLKIKLATDFGKVSNVRVIARTGQEEQQTLEKEEGK